MKYKIKDIAKILKGEIVGDDNLYVTGISKIEDGKPETLSFLSNLKYEQYIYTTKASVILVDRDFEPKEKISCTLIKVDSAYKSLAVLLEMYESQSNSPKGKEKPVHIARSAKIGDKHYIGAFVYIGENTIIGNNVKIYPNTYISGNVVIGDNTTIYSGVNIYRNTIIGSNCIIHSGAVIGADGFGFAPSGEKYDKVSQIGNVVIEDDVEIGANTCIDRGTIGSTTIKSGVKLDNLIQIAHNVVVDTNTVIAAQTGIAGTTKIGKSCIIGGQVGFVGHLKIGDKVQIAAQSGIASNIKDEAILRGSPAFKLSDYQKSTVIFRKLPDIYSKIRELEKEIEIIKNK